MKLAELLANFGKNLVSPEIYTSQDEPARQKVFTHYLYPLSQLTTLIKILKEESQENNASDYSVKYLVDCEGKILFARNGVSSAQIPAHKEMRNMCLAAGVIFFTKDFISIDEINCVSDSFTQNYSSLVWPLTIFLYLEGADPFIVEENKAHPLKIANLLSLTPNQYRELLPTTLKKAEDLIDINSATQVEIRQSHIIRPPLQPTAFTDRGEKKGSLKQSPSSSINLKPSKASNNTFEINSAFKTSQTKSDEMKGIQKRLVFDNITNSKNITPNNGRLILRPASPAGTPIKQSCQPKPVIRSDFFSPKPSLAGPSTSADKENFSDQLVKPNSIKYDAVR